MNILLFIGFLVAVGSILSGFLLEHGSLIALLSPSAFAIVVGGTIGIALITSPISSLRLIPGSLRMVFGRSRQKDAELVELLCGIANKARREGILSLEGEAEKMKDPFLRRGLGYIADGVDPEYLRSMLDNEIDTELKKHLAVAQVFDNMGGTAPTMGVLGTVMGMTNVLAKMSSDMSLLGKNIAVAFIATLYGVGTANILWLPMAGHIKALAESRADYGRMILEGLMAIQSGEPASRLRDRLESMMAHKPKHAPENREEGEPES